MAHRSYPILLDLGAVPRGTVVCFAPHPDDEIIGCGGTLAFHAERGDRVEVVYLTDGAGGDREGRVEADLVHVRRREAERACFEIGVEEALFWDYPDGGLADREDELIGRVEEAVARSLPAVLYYPSPFEIHPDHLAASRIVSRGWARTTCSGWAMLCEIGHPVPASHLLDVTRQEGRKRAAIRCYESQLLYHDIEGKSLAHNRARSVNIDIPEVRFVEAFLRAERGRVAEIERLADGTFSLVQSLM